MCVLIDINTLHCIFDGKSNCHIEFAPVLKWLKNNRRVKIVYGGSKYSEELKKAIKYLKIISLFKSSGQVCEINNELIDKYENILENKCNKSAFNDKHLAAIISVSGCRIICSKDRKSYDFLTYSNCYPISMKAPKIYSNINNKKLLTNSNIVNLRNIGSIVLKDIKPILPKCSSSKVKCNR